MEGADRKEMKERTSQFAYKALQLGDSIPETGGLVDIRVIPSKMKKKKIAEMSARR